MRRISQIIPAFFIGFLFLAASADAQVKVAVIDLGVVFESHPAFTSSMKNLEAEMKRFEETHRTQQKNLVEKFKQLRLMDSSTDAYRKQEIELSQSSASLDVQKKLKIREFGQKEASVYYSVYQDIQKKIQNFCNSRRITLVIHYNSTQMDPNKPRSVMARINSDVIFARKTGGDINITSQIIQMCGGVRTANGGQGRLRRN